MREIQRFKIPTRYNQLNSLYWSGDHLIDSLRGVRYSLDGTCTDYPSGGGFRFDRAICSPDGIYSIAYEQLGTKGLIWKNGKWIREINRSCYYADRYEYPLTIFTWFDGRTVIAHCPEEYNRLEIEVIETGERVVLRNSKSMDFFQSQLQTSSDGRYLLSAGWVWHPFNAVSIYDLKAVQENPENLDKAWSGFTCGGLSEVYTARFLDSSRVALAGDYDVGDDTVNFLCVHDIEANKTLSKVQVEEAPGIMMGAGDFVVSFFKNPKLIDLNTGKVVYRWDEISSGLRSGCFINDLEPNVPVALDETNKRFAVGTADSITVIQLG